MEGGGRQSAGRRHDGALGAASGMRVRQLSYAQHELIFLKGAIPGSVSRRSAVGGWRSLPIVARG